MRNTRILYRFVRDIERSFERAKKIRTDPEKAKRTVRFGLWAVFCSVLGGLCILCLLAYKLVGLSILASVLGIAGMFFGIVSTIICLVHTWIYWGFQIWVNRGFITWLSLILCIAIYAISGFALYGFIVS